MYTQIIGKRKIKIYLRDTGRLPGGPLRRALLPKLDQATKLFDDLIFGTSNNILKLPQNNFSGVSQIDLCLTLCGKCMIRSLNRTWRKKDKVTDVLSFPIHESLRKPLKVKDRKFLVGMINLGDIYICKEIAKKQALDFEISLYEEIIHQFVHGLLHLLGFDHEISQKEHQIMQAYEADLVKRILKR